jgi:hypothetical protein
MRTFLVVTFIAAASCATPGAQAADRANRAQLSAGHVGCDPVDITISAVREGRLEAKNWDATCRGYRFKCAAVRVGENVSQISCAPAID